MAEAGAASVGDGGVARSISSPSFQDAMPLAMEGACDEENVSLQRHVDVGRHGELLRPLAFPEAEGDATSSDASSPPNSSLIPSSALSSCSASCLFGGAGDLPVPCLVCEEQFSDKQEFLQHLFARHKIVIRKTEDVCSMKMYAEHWKRRLASVPVTDVAVIIKTNCDSDLPSEDYIFISDALPEDKELRAHLQKKRLEAVLEVQQKERVDQTFSRRCLFCDGVFTGNRSLIFQHMLDTHSFCVGNPDNLVFVGEYIDLLHHKLENLQCLYCGRTFKDRVVLREHMRKKQHRKINPNNCEYDRFYVINYLEPGKRWEEVLAENDREIVNSDNEWDGWLGSSPLIFCLFCKHSNVSIEAVLDHMKCCHRFDLKKQLTDLGLLDCYAQIKVINFIRRQVYCRKCINCQQLMSTDKELLMHMGFKGHFSLPSDHSVWNQPQYFFPTYENDALLCHLFTTDDTS